MQQITNDFLPMASRHSIERAKERAGINEKRAAKMIATALERGKTYHEFSSWERTFLQNTERDRCIAIAYAGFCYVVNEYGQCVTLYPLPTWFGKKKPFNGKERIRKAKVYDRKYAYTATAYSFDYPVAS